jgi:hypothetical protein
VAALRACVGLWVSAWGWMGKYVGPVALTPALPPLLRLAALRGPIISP